MELLSIDPLGRRRQPLGSDLRPDRASQFQSRLNMEAIRLSIEIESIVHRAWSGTWSLTDCQLELNQLFAELGVELGV